MIPPIKLLYNLTNNIKSLKVNLNRESIFNLLKLIMGININCSKLWSNNNINFENNDNLIEEYKNSNINNVTQSECQKQLWNNWFLICIYVSCFFIFLSYIEHLKNEIMIKPIFKKTTNKAVIWPIYSFISMNILYILWYNIAKDVFLFKYFSLLILLLFLKVNFL